MFHALLQQYNILFFNNPDIIAKNWQVLRKMKKKMPLVKDKQHKILDK